MQDSRSRLFLAVGAALAVGTTACSDAATIIGPNNQLEVANATDSFEFQVTGLDNVTQTLDYTWENTGTEATVDISSTLNEGTARITIADAEGTEVFSADLSGSNNTNTTVGVAGMWTIVVDFVGTAGTFNFRVQRKVQ